MKAFGARYAGRRVLVTGHTGFKGSWLALWLEMLGARVAGLSLPAPTTPSHHALLRPAFDEALVDLRDAAAVRGALARFAPQIVFHLAAQPLVRASYREPAQTFDTNVMGLVNLLEAVRVAPAVRAVLVVTTDKCYENREWEFAYRETDALGGHDPYSASKACAEIVSASWRASFLGTDDGRGHPVLLATARAGNVIGGGDWAAERIVPDLARALDAGETVRVRRPSAVLPWQHVLEPLAGYLALGARLLDGDACFADAFNFGPADDDTLTVGELVRAFERHWPALRCEFATADDGPHEAGLLRLDSARARSRLGWRPVWRSERAVERTAAWYRRHLDDGGVDSAGDVERFVADARDAGAPWSLE